LFVLFFHKVRMNEHAHTPIVVELPRVGVPYAMRRDPDYTIREENAEEHRLLPLWLQGSALQENDGPMP
jgi:hypothetical protein